MADRNYFGNSGDGRSGRPGISFTFTTVGPGGSRTYQWGNNTNGTDGSNSLISQLQSLFRGQRQTPPQFGGGSMGEGSMRGGQPLAAFDWLTQAFPAAYDAGYSDNLNEIAAQIFEQQERQRHPTEHRVLETMQEIPLTAEDIARNPSDAITMEDFHVGDKAVRLPCGHAFAKEGLVNWLRDNNTCPVCRTQLPEETTRQSSDRSNTSNSQSRASSTSTTQLPWPLSVMFGGRSGEMHQTAAHPVPTSLPSAQHSAYQPRDSTTGTDLDDDAILQAALERSLRDTQTTAVPPTATATDSQHGHESSSERNDGSHGEDSDDLESIIRQSLEGLDLESLRQQCEREQICIPDGSTRTTMISALLSKILAQPERQTESPSGPQNTHEGVSIGPTAPALSNTRNRQYTLNDFLSAHPITEEPSQGEDVVTLKFRCPDGKQLQRRFYNSDTIADVLAFVAASSPGVYSVDAATGDPQFAVTVHGEKEPKSDLSLSLLDAGLGSRAALVVEHTTD